MNKDRLVELGLLGATMYAILRYIRMLKNYSIPILSTSNENFASQLEEYPSIFDSKQLYDCDGNTPVRCFNDIDCLSNCQSGEYNCTNGKCTNLYRFDGNPSCNSQLGCVALLKGNTTGGFAQFDCYSTIPYINSTCEGKSPWVCNGGQLIEQDYRIEFPSQQSCIPPAGSVTIMHRPGGGVLAVPITINGTVETVDHILQANTSTLYYE